MPVGNGMIGANLFGGVDEPSMQFTVDSVWTGSENPSGTYNAENRKVKITAKK